MLLSLVSQPKNSHQAIIDLEQLWIPVKIIIEVQYELIYFFNHVTVMEETHNHVVNEAIIYLTY